MHSVSGCSQGQINRTKTWISGLLASASPLAKPMREAGSWGSLERTEPREASNRDVPVSCSTKHSVSSLGDILATADGCKCQDHTYAMSVKRRAPVDHHSAWTWADKDPKPWQWAGPAGPVSLCGSSMTGWGPRASAALWALSTDTILFVIISSTLPGGNGASEANLCAQDHRPVKIQPNRRGFECSCGNSSRLPQSHHEAGANHLCVTETC